MHYYQSILYVTDTNHAGIFTSVLTYIGFFFPPNTVNPNNDSFSKYLRAQVHISTIMKFLVTLNRGIEFHYKDRHNYLTSYYKFLLVSNFPSPLLSKNTKNCLLSLPLLRGWRIEAKGS